MKCAVCGAKCERIGRGKYRVNYCSQECRNKGAIAVRRKRHAPRRCHFVVESTCQRCGRTFNQSPRYGSRKQVKFCSHDCRYPAPVLTRTCMGCGVAFTPKDSRAHFCTRKCGATTRNRELRAGLPRGPILGPKPRPKVNTSGYFSYETKAGHRALMAGVLGRALEPSEHVHHINGMKAGRDTGQMVVVTPKEHARAHASLVKAGFEAYRRGLLGFDRESKTYFVVG